MPNPGLDDPVAKPPVPPMQDQDPVGPEPGLDAAPEEPLITSPQRRTIGDFQAKKSLEKLKDRLGEAGGTYHDDAPGKGPSYYSEPIGPMGQYVTISFKDKKTMMQLCARGKAEIEGTGPAVFMEKITEGYNVDSAFRFVKQAQKVIEILHSMY